MLDMFFYLVFDALLELTRFDPYLISLEFMSHLSIVTYFADSIGRTLHLMRSRILVVGSQMNDQELDY